MHAIDCTYFNCPQVIIEGFEFEVIASTILLKDLTHTPHAQVLREICIIVRETQVILPIPTNYYRQPGTRVHNSMKVV